MSGRRASLYVRVSTDAQTTDNQRQELKEVASRHGWTIAHVFVDHGVGGAKGREQRAQLDAMLKAVARREVDLVAAWSVDRLGRSLQDLVGLLAELHAKRVDLYLHQEGLDTTTPAGKAMFQMMGVFAEFERSMIRERVNAGLARARREGKRLGRPPASDRKMAKARELTAEGLSVRRLAAQAGISVGLAHRVKTAVPDEGRGGATSSVDLSAR